MNSSNPPTKLSLVDLLAKLASILFNPMSTTSESFILYNVENPVLIFMKYFDSDIQTCSSMELYLSSRLVPRQKYSFPRSLRLIPRNFVLTDLVELKTGQMRQRNKQLLTRDPNGLKWLSFAVLQSSMSQ